MVFVSVLLLFQLGHEGSNFGVQLVDLADVLGMQFKYWLEDAVRHFLALYLVLVALDLEHVFKIGDLCIFGPVEPDLVLYLIV